MNRYLATARREGDWWVIDVDGVGVTQAKRLDKVDHMARDFVAAMLDLDYDAVQVSVGYELPVAAVDALTEAKTSNEAAKQLAKIAADSGRRTATVLHEQGLSLRDIAHLLGVSFQRVHQLLGEPMSESSNDAVSREKAWERALRAVREAARADSRTATGRRRRTTTNVPVPASALPEPVEPIHQRVAG